MIDDRTHNKYNRTNNKTWNSIKGLYAQSTKFNQTYKKRLKGSCVYIVNQLTHLMTQDTVDFLLNFY